MTGTNPPSWAQPSAHLRKELAPRSDITSCSSHSIWPPSFPNHSKLCTSKQSQASIHVHGCHTRNEQELSTLSSSASKNRAPETEKQGQMNSSPSELGGWTAVRRNDDPEPANWTGNPLDPPGLVMNARLSCHVISTLLELSSCNFEIQAPQLLSPQESLYGASISWRQESRNGSVVLSYPCCTDDSYSSTHDTTPRESYEANGTASQSRE